VEKRLAVLGSVSSLSVSRDGKWLVAAAGEPGLFGEATLFALPGGDVVRRFTAHRDSLYAAALSPDGKKLATGSYDQQIKVWNVADGRELHTLVGHNGAIFDLAFHPNSRVLASASADRTIKLWDTERGSRLETFSQPTKEQYAVAFSPDGKKCYGAGGDNRIRVWGLSESMAENTNPLLITRFAHEGAIIKLDFSIDGKTLASAAEDRTVRLWNATEVKERLLLPKQNDWVAALALAPDAKSLLLGRVDGTFALVDTAKGQPIVPAKPELTAVQPSGVERGKPSMVTLVGKHLAGAEQVVVRFGGKPIAAAAKLQPVDPKQVDQRRVELTVPASQPRGMYQVAVVSAAGVSGEVTLFVDDLPQQFEREPNNQFMHANSVTLPVAVWGTVSSRGDVDQFAFQAKKGETVVLELAAKAINSPLNGQLILTNPAGDVVASNNDFDGGSDPLVAYTLPADGRYQVRVQDLTFMGSDKHHYRLSIGSFPLVTGVFPQSVPVARETKVSLVGFNLPADATVTVKPTTPGETPVVIDANRFRSLRSFNVLASADQEVVEREPNDLPTQATAVPTITGETIVQAGGRIWPQGKATSDVDLFRFKARKGVAYTLETTAARRGSPIDTKLEVLDTQGKAVDRVWLQAVRDSYVTFRPVTSDVLDIRVQNWEEMELNELLYFQGEVCKAFRMPQGPDSGIQFYNTNGKRRGYFDTTPTAHALEEACYVVEPHPPGTQLPPNGLPVFKLPYANDDESERTLGSDSRLQFVAPAEGDYLVRVSDTRGFSGDRYSYRLTIREARPDFVVKLNTTDPKINSGSSVGLTFRAERIDGFEDDIRIDVTGVPEGFRVATPITIQAGHLDARVPLTMLATTTPKKLDWSSVKITATAKIAGKDLVKTINALGQPKVAAMPKVVVKLEPAELTIVPGQSVSATLKIDRKDFKDRVQFSVPNLPHGVIVDNIGLSGILIPEGQSERTIFLKCAPWVPETDRYFFAETINVRGGAADAGAQTSDAVLLKVRKQPVVAMP
jgi:WD40 repeat protein